MNIKLKIEDAKYPVPNYFRFTFISKTYEKYMVVTNQLWMCSGENYRNYYKEVTDNIRTILKDSPCQKLYY